VLCSDKTGTLTDGTVRLHETHNLDGQPSDDVYRFAYINAKFQAGFANPIDHALCSARPVELTGVTRLDEVPYDFGRKRLSVLVDDNQRRILITKGAMANVLERCTHALTTSGQVESIDAHRQAIDDQFRALGSEGFRVLGLAFREFEGNTAGLNDECDLTFLGTVIFYDPPKPGIVETLAQLREMGVGLKMITGDNHVVAAAVGRQVGLEHSEVMTGSELRQLSGDSLAARVSQVDVFAEIEPNQKEQIILALKQTGQVVGYMGDGINDASALHAADVGISVATAVDVAKEAAQVVLLEHDLSVLICGVREGRRTFANTLKYVFFVIAGNFGYMFSLAVASICMRSILVYLGIRPFDDPLLPGQILLVNLLADFPAMALASDNVDPELIQRPRNWDVRALARFMIVFGLTSSLFDFITFGVSVLLFRADEVMFHSLWFVQSVLTGLLIMFIIRTRRPFFSSWPGRLFMLISGIIAVVAVALPYAPFHASLGFAPLSAGQLAAIAVICVMYTFGIEAVKAIFYRVNP
jgi:Mg2+-importing ATPase